MTAGDITIIIAAAAQAASVIIGIGALNQKLTDVRDDMRELRGSLQNFLQILAVSRCPPPPETPATPKVDP
jgi:hypothetical protein